MSQSCWSIRSLSLNDLIFLPPDCVGGGWVQGEGERAQERRDGSQMEGGRFQRQWWPREMFLPSIWNTHTHAHSWAEALSLTLSEIKSVCVCGVADFAQCDRSSHPRAALQDCVCLLGTWASLADKDSWWHLKRAHTRAGTDISHQYTLTEHEIWYEDSVYEVMWMWGVVLGDNRQSCSMADNSEPKYRDWRMYNREGVVPGFRAVPLVCLRGTTKWKWETKWKDISQYTEYNNT